MGWQRGQREQREALHRVVPETRTPFATRAGKVKSTTVTAFALMRSHLLETAPQTVPRDGSMAVFANTR